MSNNKLDNIISGLDANAPIEKLVSKTISMRLPVLYLAKIDALAGMKDVSRNVLLNEIISAALNELEEKLATKSPEVAKKLVTKSQDLAKIILAEHEHEPRHPPKPKHH